MTGSRPFSVTAIISAYNEEDIIGPVVGDLVDQGIQVYLIDNGSTDATVAEAERRGTADLLRVERFAGDASRFEWGAILKRKQELARDLDSDWFLHQDADEFRESPWSDRNLRQGIEAVDRFGYNAIDFEVLNFPPTHDAFRRGDDPREAFSYWEPCADYDKVQVKCWKKCLGAIDLVSTGGHEAIFEERKVFPLRFLLRHYPIRGQGHGLRKVFSERRPRFTAAERTLGWHRQYDALGSQGSFLREPAGLTRYDADAVRLHLVLSHRIVEDLQQAPAAIAREVAEAARERDRISRELHARSLELERLTSELHARNLELGRLGRELETANMEAARVSRELHVRNIDAERLGAELHARNLEAEHLRDEIARLRPELEKAWRDLEQCRARLEAVVQSKTWRWSAPLRAAASLVSRS